MYNRPSDLSSHGSEDGDRDRDRERERLNERHMNGTKISKRKRDEKDSGVSITFVIKFILISGFY